MLTISDVAERSGVPAGTLRMWEDRHGFPHPQRLESGHRRYTEDQVDAIRAVVGARAAGLSLGAAIERVAGAGAGEERRDSIFGLLRRHRPELAPDLIPKSRMIALSHAIEDECLAGAYAPVLIGSFQRTRFFRAAEPRWRTFAQGAAVTVAFVDLMSPRRTRAGRDADITRVVVDRSHPLNREWAIVCYAPGACAALAGLEAPGQAQRPDSSRRFEAIWTVDPELVYDAALAAAAIAERNQPRTAQRLRDALGPRPAPSAPEARAVAGLARRMVSYVSEPA